MPKAAGVAARKGPSRLPEGGAAGPSSFADVVTLHETPLLRYVGQLVGPAEAEDIVQEAFLKLHRQTSTSGPESVRNVSSWLFRVAHNLALDSERRKATRDGAREGAAREGVRVKQNGPEGIEALVREAACERALAEVRSLPPRQKHVLLLRVIQDMKLRDIAMVTGMTLGNVAYLLNQALRELARRLKAAGVI